MADLSIEPCAIVQAESWPGTSARFEAEFLRQLAGADISEPPLPAMQGEGKGEGPGEGRRGGRIDETEALRPSPGPSPYLSPQAGRGGVGVADHSASSLPSAFGEVVSVGIWQVVRLAPRRFWLIADTAPDLPLTIDPALGCILSLTEGRMRLKLSGPHTFDILAACLAIDWNSPQAQPGRAVQTGFHHVPVLALRSAADACDLIVPRSFAQSLAEWLAEVARPYRARNKVTA